jgi:small nuclear ribonucleoprotein (snRNP)-like protein
MPDLPAREPDRYFLELVGRLYAKRDKILESSNRLADLAYKLEACDNREVKGILSGISKELNSILSSVYELSPHLKDPGMAEQISAQVRVVSCEVERAASHPGDYEGLWAMSIRTTICQDANKTQLKLTPRSIKQALGIAVSPRDIRLLLERGQDSH